jgi:hypothetical protein
MRKIETGLLVTSSGIVNASDPLADRTSNRIAAAMKMEAFGRDRSGPAAEKRSGSGSGRQ